MKDSTLGAVVYIAILLLGISFGIGMCVGGCSSDITTKRTFQTEAVKHKAAQWVVHDDGTTEFLWNEGVEEER